MNTSNMPGFTAVTSLYKSSGGNYRAQVANASGWRCGDAAVLFEIHSYCVGMQPHARPPSRALCRATKCCCARCAQRLASSD